MADLFKKLPYKGSDKRLSLNVPDEFLPHLAEIGTAPRIDAAFGGHETYDFALTFVKSSYLTNIEELPLLRLMVHK